ncbi:MAG: hypothetical protein ABFD04_01835 [Syntrophomonas sp.]
MSGQVNKVLVEILQGTAPQGGCNCSGCASSSSCGSAVDWEAEIEKLSGELTASFGDKVEVKYVDVDKEGLGNYPAVGRVLQMGYPYPITMINGQPKFAGGILSNDIKTSINDLLGSAG